MNKCILPFIKEIWLANDDFKDMVDRTMAAKPIMNLTEDEVIITLRFLELKKFLQEGRWDDIVVSKNDKRLELCDDKDKFLAMLADCDKRDYILNTKRCRRLFGGTPYYWRKIAHQCPIITVASALSENGDGGYYGKGWVVAAHINTLIEWIKEHGQENYHALPLGKACENFEKKEE